MHGYLLVKKNDVVFFGDGLEKAPGIKKVDRLKFVGKYLKSSSALEIEDVFTFAESRYLRSKNSKFRIKIKPVQSPVDKIRTIKESGEIEKIRKSMRIGGRVFEIVKKELKKKLWTEKALANFIRNAGLKFGAEEVSFEPIVASGANAAIPHHVPSNKRLYPGESIILDFGFKTEGYCGDFTRTVFMRKVSKTMEMAYRHTEAAYIQSLIAARPGVACRNLYSQAVKILGRAKLDKYFIHNLGHGTGLEIHESPNLSPNSRDRLENNMVFSVEPGVYIPKVGGVRIEDLVFLDHDKLHKFVFASTKLEDNIIR